MVKLEIMILVITPERRTVYNHDEFLTKRKNGHVEIVNVRSRETIDIVIPESIQFKGNILEIKGKEW